MQEKLKHKTYLELTVDEHQIAIVNRLAIAGANVNGNRRPI